MLSLKSKNYLIPINYRATKSQPWNHNFEQRGSDSTQNGQWDA